MKVKKFFTILILVLAASLSYAQQRVTIKIASVAPSRSPWEIEQKNLALEFSKITGGKVNLQFFDVNALGGENGVIQKMRSVRPGQKSPIDGAVLTSIGIYELAPKSNSLTLSVPFLFRNQDELTYILNNYSDEMRDAIREQGFELLGWFSVGWANFLTKEEVRTPEKIKALRMSVGGFTSPELGRAFQKVGYTTEDLPNEKIMASIKSANGVKGLYTIPMYAYATQYFKSLPYIIVEPLCPVMTAFVISKKAWDTIPDEYKPALISAVKKAESKFIGVQQKNDSEFLDKIEKEGGTLVRLTPAEMKLWEETLTEDAKKLAEDKDIKVINVDFLQRVDADLRKFRAGN
ncbi:MAG: TRAP transporter substrate-binding protein DctP [Treponema sp.]|nr:TRAP transporter substrate-binding protein DctP [Treponema sp.]